MGNGYTRQSATEIVDSGTIFAGDLNDEFDQLELAFSSSSGHSHDGSLGEGPPISLVTSVIGILPVINGGTGVNSISGLKTALELGSLAYKQGPSTTVDNSLPRFDGTSGNLQTSLVKISDTGVITVPDVVLNGLANGVGDTDAATVSQLNAVIESVSDLSDEVDDIVESLDNLSSYPIAVLKTPIDIGSSQELSVYSAWTTVPVTSKTYDTHGIVTLTSNEFTCSENAWIEFDVAGVYRMEVSSSNNNIGSLEFRLYNVTDSTVVVQGSSHRIRGQGTNRQESFHCFGTGFLNAGKTYRLEYYAWKSQNTPNTNDILFYLNFNHGSISGRDVNPVDIKIWKR